jgi:hypothetical protein
MPTHDLRESQAAATVSGMVDPLPILIARERVRSGIEGPLPEPRPPRRGRRHLAAALRRLADRLEGGPREPGLAR